MRFLIKNGTIVTASDVVKADVLIENEKISQIGIDLLDDNARTINALGNYLFPGTIDPHTHLDMPFENVTTSDDFFTGTKAAIMGGVTTIIDFSLQKKGQSLQQAIDSWHMRAAGKCFTDYAFHVAITDCNNEVVEEIKTLPKTTGVSTIKLFLAYKNLFQIEDETMYKIFKTARQSGILVGVHCENGNIINALIKEAISKGQNDPIYHALTRPDDLEAESISRAITIACIAKAPLYIVHLSSAKGLNIALKARQNGQKVYLETCPQYLLLDDSRYIAPGIEGAKFVMSSNT